MPTADEIARIAAAMNAVRPDWRTSSLVTFLTRHHANRPYRDLAVAAMAVATDERTQTPQLLNQHGPWWVAAQTAAGQVTDHRFARCPEPGHSSYPAHNCGACKADAAESAGEAIREQATPDPEQLERNARWATRLRGTTPRTEVR